MKIQKKLLIVLTLVAVIIVSACTSKKKSEIPQTDFGNEKNEMNSDKTAVNIEELETLVKQAKALNTEVVIAITILHHNELKDLGSKMFDHNINAYEKEKLFEARKNEFFDKLQFSYNEYTAYIAEHSAQINNYITSHPEIMDYLRTENRGEE